MKLPYVIATKTFNTFDRNPHTSRIVKNFASKTTNENVLPKLNFVEKAVAWLTRKLVK